MSYSDLTFHSWGQNFLPAKKSKIVVGMSGGVDSSVSALILKALGHEVIGLFMKNWDEVGGPCPAEQDFADVARVCEKIGIPFFPIEFVKEYRDSVFSWFLKEYQAGHTPNPDILCNREIKFKVFYEQAKALGADYLATGHYAQHVVQQTLQGERHAMAKGLDNNKDQTYFLMSMQDSVLKDVIFPVGHLPKPEVRRLAKEAGLSVMDKKDSTGICFIGERNFREFLGQYLKANPGRFCHLDGTVVGTHQGQHFYTLGQRKGLGLGGQGAPWFVVAKDVESNIVYVERGDDHTALYSTTLTADELSLVGGDASVLFSEGLTARVRYRQSVQTCRVLNVVGDTVEVEFPIPQRAVTPRQAIVFYKDDVCLGGAMIKTVGKSLWHQGISELPNLASESNSDLSLS